MLGEQRHIQIILAIITNVKVLTLVYSAPPILFFRSLLMFFPFTLLIFSLKANADFKMLCTHNFFKSWHFSLNLFSLLTVELWVALRQLFSISGPAAAISKIIHGLICNAFYVTSVRCTTSKWQITRAICVQTLY